jgi:hypothetical protein
MGYTIGLIVLFIVITLINEHLFERKLIRKAKQKEGVFLSDGYYRIVDALEYAELEQKAGYYDTIKREAFKESF